MLGDDTLIKKEMRKGIQPTIYFRKNLDQPGKLCLAIRDVKEVAAALHEGVNLCEDAVVVPQGLHDPLHGQGVHHVVVHALPRHTTSEQDTKG